MFKIHSKAIGTVMNDSFVLYLAMLEEELYEECSIDLRKYKKGKGGGGGGAPSGRGGKGHARGKGKRGK